MKPTSLIRDLGSLPEGGEASTSGPGERAGQLNRAGFQMPVHEGSAKVTGMSAREASQEGWEETFDKQLGVGGGGGWGQVSRTDHETRL